MVTHTSAVDLEAYPSAKSEQRSIESSADERDTILESPRQKDLGSVLVNTMQGQPGLPEGSQHRSDQDDSLPKPMKALNLPQLAIGDTASPSAHDWVSGHQLGVVCRGPIAQGAFGEVHSVILCLKRSANINRCWTTGFLR